MPAREIDGDFEGFGIVYMDAAFFSKPVIAGDSGGVRDAVIDNETGLLVDPNNIESIKNAILELYNNPEKSLALGKQARERALADFSWEKQVGLVYKLITKK